MLRSLPAVRTPAPAWGWLTLLALLGCGPAAPSATPGSPETGEPPGGVAEPPSSGGTGVAAGGTDGTAADGTAATAGGAPEPGSPASGDTEYGGAASGAPGTRSALPAPWWGRSLGTADGRRRPGRYQASLTAPEALEIPPLETERFEGLLRCDLTASGFQADPPFGRADLAVALRLDGVDPPRWIRGPDNTERIVFTVPRLTLGPETSLSFQIYDRDLLVDDHLSVASAPFGGHFPVSVAAHPALRCDGLPQGELAPILDEAVRAAETALQSADSLRPDTDDVGLIWPTSLEPARRAVVEVAALDGWAGPAARPLVDRFAARLASWESAVLAQLSERSSQLPTVESGPHQLSSEVSVTLRTPLCGEDLPAAVRPMAQGRVPNAPCVVPLTVAFSPGEFGAQPPTLTWAAYGGPLELVGRSTQPGEFGAAELFVREAAQHTLYYATSIDIAGTPEAQLRPLVARHRGGQGPTDRIFRLR